MRCVSSREVLSDAGKENVGEKKKTTYSALHIYCTECDALLQITLSNKALAIVDAHQFLLRCAGEKVMKRVAFFDRQALCCITT